MPHNTHLPVIISANTNTREANALGYPGYSGVCKARTNLGKTYLRRQDWQACFTNCRIYWISSILPTTQSLNEEHVSPTSRPPVAHRPNTDLILAGISVIVVMLPLQMPRQITCNSCRSLLPCFCEHELHSSTSILLQRPFHLHSFWVGVTLVEKGVRDRSWRANITSSMHPGSPCKTRLSNVHFKVYLNLHTLPTLVLDFLKPPRNPRTNSKGRHHAYNRGALAGRLTLRHPSTPPRLEVKVG